MNKRLTASENSKLSRTFRIRVESIYDQLKSAERSAVNAILFSENINEESTIADISAEAGCSNATLVRLARKLGYKGFADMKPDMFKNEEYVLAGPRLDHAADAGDTVSSFFKVAISSLADTERLLNVEHLVTAAKLIKNSSKILFTGSGDAHLIAYAGHLKFHKAGYYSMCSADFDDQLMNASRLGPGDTLVAVSHSGITKTVCALAKCAKNLGANIITVTAYPLSRLAKMSDITIITPTFTENLYDEVVSKRIPVLAIMEALFLLAVNKGDRAVMDSLQRSNTALENNKLTTKQPEHLW